MLLPLLPPPPPLLLLILTDIVYLLEVLPDGELRIGLISQWDVSSRRLGVRLP